MRTLLLLLLLSVSPVWADTFTHGDTDAFGNFTFPEFDAEVLGPIGYVDLATSVRQLSIVCENTSAFQAQWSIDAGPDTTTVVPIQALTNLNAGALGTYTVTDPPWRFYVFKAQSNSPGNPVTLTCKGVIK